MLQHKKGPNILASDKILNMKKNVQLSILNRNQQENY